MRAGTPASVMTAPAASIQVSARPGRGATRNRTSYGLAGTHRRVNRFENSGAIFVVNGVGKKYKRAAERFGRKADNRCDIVRPRHRVRSDVPRPDAYPACLKRKVNRCNIREKFPRHLRSRFVRLPGCPFRRGSVHTLTGRPRYFRGQGPTLGPSRNNKIAAFAISPRRRNIGRRSAHGCLPHQ